MDATSDKDTVDRENSLRPTPKRKPKKAKISVKMLNNNLEKDGENKDSSGLLSNVQIPDVAGQLYLFDASEEPNVSMRQSHLEEFIYRILLSRDGVPAEIFTDIVAYMMHLCSPRFKREVFFYMTRSEDGKSFHYIKPTFTGPSAQEIYS